MKIPDKIIKFAANIQCMREIQFREALNEAMREEMRRDERVFFNRRRSSGV